MAVPRQSIPQRDGSAGARAGRDRPARRPALLRPEALTALDPEAFRAARPFPWLGVTGLVSDEGFAQLCAGWPAAGRFERTQGHCPPGILRAHDRWYLAYDPRADALPPRPGRIGPAALPDCWRAFIDELSAPAYQRRVRALFGGRPFTTRFAWHVAGAGDEVSPHRDAGRKLGTHLVYCNRADDWRPDWGGATLLLGAPRPAVALPDFADFADVTAAPLLGNQSLVFANGPAAWHGVEPLRCPPGRERRLFTVVFNHPLPVHLARLAIRRLRQQVAALRRGPADARQHRAGHASGSPQPD